MILNELHLRDFRNYEKLDLTLHPELNILIGPNGAGKTNILESLLVLSNTRSFRCDHDREMIRKDAEYARIEAASTDERFRVLIQKSGKSLFYNGENIRKSSDYIGKLNVILFKPDDLFLFDTSPKERRSVLDVEIGKVSKNYLKQLLEYHRLLQDKNALLKQESINEALLDITEEAMLERILQIDKEREEFFAFLNERIAAAYRQLAGTNEEVSIVYKPCCDGTKEDIRSHFQKNREREKILGFALYGPHKEDYSFQFEHYPASSYASQGQKRMIMIAFKYSLYEYIHEKTKRRPLVLLDDVLSELDQKNRERLFALLPQAQTILTGTDLQGIDLSRDHRIFQVREGEVL